MYSSNFNGHRPRDSLFHLIAFANANQIQNGGEKTAYKNAIIRIISPCPYISIYWIGFNFHRLPHCTLNGFTMLMHCHFVFMLMVGIKFSTELYVLCYGKGKCGWWQLYLAPITCYSNYISSGERLNTKHDNQLKFFVFWYIWLESQQKFVGALLKLFKTNAVKLYSLINTGGEANESTLQIWILRNRWTKQLEQFGLFPKVMTVLGFSKPLKT